MNKRHANELLHTEFINTGRIAGMGITYDRYDDESGCPNYNKSKKITFPSDGLTDAELKALNGPVIVRKLAINT